MSKSSEIFTYEIPTHLEKEISVGIRVEVPLGRRRQIGLVLNTHYNKPEFTTRPIIDVIEVSPLVSARQLEFWAFLAEYYMCPINKIVQAAIPKILKGEVNRYVQLSSGFNESDALIRYSKLKGKRGQNAWVLVKTLLSKGRCAIKDVEQLWSKKSVIADLKFLEASGDILFVENRSFIETRNLESIIYVVLPNSENEFEDLLKQNRRAKKQMELLSLLWIDGCKRWPKKYFIEHFSCSIAVFSALKEKGILIEKKEEPKAEIIESSKELLSLTEEQAIALNSIKNSFSKNKNVLLKGVTSSGKTLIYTYLLKSSLEMKGGQCLYLLPEIAITTQIIKYLELYFGDKVLIYHSKLNAKERGQAWQRIANGEACVVLGVRSSVFLPFKNLKLIIVDEEHDFSYKQQEPAPRYNARDCALVMAKYFKSNVLLGSATPSLESYFNALKGKFTLVELNKRYSSVALPEIYLVGINQMLRKGESRPILSDELRNAMTKSLIRGKQVILFQNRRGYVPLLSCTDCEYIPVCKHCDITLTFHKKANILKCHYCGFSQKAVSECIECGSPNLRMRSFGTERIEEYLQIVFPNYSIARMDFDTTQSKNGHKHIIQDFENEKVDILVGTQMLTKGLDFANVEIVGILNAESLLYYPDFRANERAFALMKQVAGRAGRRNERGKVYIQTTDIENEVLQHLLIDEVRPFMHSELKFRKLFHYPPFFRLIRIELRAEKKMPMEQKAIQLAYALTQIKGIEILGPESAILSRVKGFYGIHILIKIDKAVTKIKSVKRELAQILDHKAKEYKKVKIRLMIDVDPF